jgi:hypothetical protein
VVALASDFERAVPGGPGSFVRYGAQMVTGR